MTPRRTLKDFLIYSGNPNVDKLSYDINNPKSGAKEKAEEGDDLGTDPNTGNLLLGDQGMLGNYLKYVVDKSSNVHKPVSSSVACQIHNSLGKTAVMRAYPS